eukprot:35795-Eustigmatos_ZCMA.PRE.1
MTDYARRHLYGHNVEGIIAEVIALNCQDLGRTGKAYEVDIFKSGVHCRSRHTSSHHHAEGQHKLHGESKPHGLLTLANGLT